MMLRLLAATAVLSLTPIKTFAVSQEQQAEQMSELEEESPERDTASAKVPEPLSVMQKANLAAHLGLSQKEVIFGKPRNFRSENMNNFQLEPLNEAEEN